MRPARTRALRPATLLCAVSVVLIGLIGAAAPASAHTPPVVPPRSHGAGPNYGALSAAWWQYVAGQPNSSSPLFDNTGAQCGVGQTGHVFFLAGTSGSGTVTRNDCVVPAGAALFFPLLNAFDVHVDCQQAPSVCDSNTTPDLIWNDLQNLGFSATSLFARIDGVPVTNLDPASSPYRACAGPVARCSAPAFSMTLPADNLFGGILPAGTYAPAVADGYYLLLHPLTPGRHTLTFGGTGTFGGGTATQDITYNLRVVADHKH